MVAADRSLLDVDDLLVPQNDGTAKALRRHMDSGGFGALGIVLLPEMLVMANAENHLTEDGGNRITLVDRRTGSLRGTVELALGSPGFPCPDYPVPYVAPFGPPRNLAVRAPDPGWGCFPDPNGLALGRATDGSAYVFSANGGTNDVSVIDLGRALRGDPRAEIGRIPTQVGPWGITATPDQAPHHRGERRESAGWIRGQHHLRDRRRPGERRRGRRRSGPRSRRHGRSLGADPSVDPLGHPRRPEVVVPNAREDVLEGEHRVRSPAILTRKLTHPTRPARRSAGSPEGLGDHPRRPICDDQRRTLVTTVLAGARSPLCDRPSVAARRRHGDRGRA